MSQERPLVSFCIKSYNQKHYVVDAIRGAFAQTYSPLEIVIADDASTDGSQEVIEGIIAAYRRTDGKHAVTFVKNTTNLGNLGNWQRLCEVAHGELLVQADGDDVSLPERAACVVQAWQDSGCKATLITNRAVSFSDDGQIVGFINSSDGQGAVSTYVRAALDKFPPLDMNLATGAGDDAIYSRRAKLFGPCICVKRVLTCYRVGSGATTANRAQKIGSYRQRMLKYGFKSELAALRQLSCDVKSLRDKIGTATLADFEAQWRKDVDYYQKCLVLWETGNVVERCHMFAHLYLFKERPLLQLIGLLLCFPRCIGDFILDSVLTVGVKLKRSRYKSYPKIGFDDLKELDEICKSF